MGEDVKVVNVKLEGLDENIKNMIELQKVLKEVNASIKDFEKAEAQVAKLEKSLKELKKTGNENTAEYKKASYELEKLKTAVNANKDANIENIKIQIETKQILQDQKREVNELIKIQNKQTGSILELREQEKLLQREYVTLSRLQREGLEGKALQETLKGVREEIRQASMAAGDFRTNVGNYSNSILDSVKSMGGFSGAAKKMSDGLGVIKMASTGVLGPIGLIILAIEKLYGLFGKTTMFEGVKASFAGVQSVISAYIDSIISYIKMIKSLLTLDFKGVKDNFNDIKDNILGVADAFKKGYNAQSEMQEIEKERIKLSVEHAEREKRISEIMIQTSFRSKKSEEEKLKLLKEAGDLQRKTSSENTALLQKELKAFEILNSSKLKKGQEDVEILKQRAELQSKIVEAQKAESDLINQIQIREDTFNKKLEKQREEEKKQREEAHKKQIQYKNERIDMTNEIAKLELQFETDLHKKSIELLKLDNKKRLEEIQRNEKITEDEKLKFIELAEKELQQKLTDLDEKFKKENIDKSLAHQKKLIDLRLELIKNDSAKEIELKLQQFEIEKQIELKNIKATSEEAELIRKKYAIRTSNFLVEIERTAAKKLANERLEALEAELLAKDLTEQQNYELNRQLLKERFEINLEEKRQNNESTLLLEAEYKDKLNKLDEQEILAKEEFTRLKIDVFKTFANSFSELASALDGQGEASANFAKALALFQIGIDTSTALSAIIANSAKASITPVQLLLNIATGTATVLSNMAKATKIATSQNTPKKKYKFGGEVIEGKTHAQGGVTFYGDNGQVFEAEGKELMFIMNKNSSEALQSLHALNNLGNIKKQGTRNNAFFEAGGNLQIYAGRNKVNMQVEMLTKALQDMPAPRVAVTEILDGVNKYSKVIETSSI